MTEMKMAISAACLVLAGLVLAEEPAAAVADDVSRPVRPVGVNGQAQWNGRALWFMYPPVFDFPCGADEDREVTVVGEGSLTKTFRAKGPFVSLESVWSELPVGNVSVACGTFSRAFWKARPFDPRRYPAPSRSYREALVAGYEYLLSLPSLKVLAETGKPDMTYCLNCYPSKMHASTVLGMVRYARLAPARRDAALRLARAAADHLLSLAYPPDAALPGFTPTYEGENLTAKRYAGLNMLIYPADSGKAFLALYGVTKDGKYLAAAKRIAETYLKLQGEDGTWYLKLREKDGTPVNKNRLHPKEVIDFMDGMFAATGDGRYRICSERAFAYFENGALQDWNWEGQFEDVEPQGKYLNLTKHGAASVAIRLLKCWPGDATRLAQARELVRFCEDQFVCWERPFKPECRPIYGRTWEPWTVEPAVVEQYSYREPVDASAAKMIRAYLALYRAERKPLDLAKARALGDACVRVQQENGRIQTIWRGDGGGLQGDWINCMFATLAALGELDSVLGEKGLR